MTQQFPGGASITWRRPLSSDGAFAMHNVTKRLEVRGAQLGSRTWTHLERIIWPASTLRKIVSNGLQIGDPNCVCLDVEVDGEKEIPNIILTAVEGSRDKKIMIAALPPPPPPPGCHSPFLSSNKRSAGLLTPAARAAKLGPVHHVSPRLLHPGWILRRNRPRLKRLVPTTRPCCVTPGDVKSGDRGTPRGGSC